MNSDKESKSRKKKNFFSFVLGGGGVGWGEGKKGRRGRYGRYEHASRHIIYTQHIVMTSSTEPYSFMKIILTVFKVESTAA